MRAIYVFLLLAAFGTETTIVNAQTRKNPEIARIDAYAKSVDASVQKHKNPHLVFADTSTYDQAKPRWQKFASARILEKFREKNEIYNSANNWIKNNKIVLSVITLSSPSGDWAKYLYLYFRDDGTLAKSNSELRTFYGDFVAQQDFYFDRNGAILKKTLKFYDLRTHKPKHLEDPYLSDNTAFINEDNYYVNTRKLPFAGLLPLAEFLEFELLIAEESDGSLNGWSNYRSKAMRRPPVYSRYACTG